MLRTIGDKSICEMCGKPIEYIGPYWRHTTPQISHIATPKKSWQGYSAATTDDEARAMFVKRYGRPPAEVRRSGGGVLCGPTPEVD